MAKQWAPADAARLVRAIFRQVLDREADDSGLITYSCRLARGEWAVRQVVRDLGVSTEYKKRFVANQSEPREVGNLMYKHFLARTPGPDELDHVYNQGRDAQQDLSHAVDVMTSGDEYTRKFGDDGVPGG